MIADAELVELALEEIGEHFGRLRLHMPEAERAMARSLRRYGQLSPVVVCLRQGRYELIDGFKRLAAARSLGEWSRLLVRVMEADDKAAKAAMYGLNRVGGKTSELEEAWIVYALVREDGVSQLEVAPGQPEITSTADPARGAYGARARRCRDPSAERGESRPATLRARLPPRGPEPGDGA